VGGKKCRGGSEEGFLRDRTIKRGKKWVRERPRLRLNFAGECKEVERKKQKARSAEGIDCRTYRADKGFQKG